jgi:hypothetical protein
MRRGSRFPLQEWCVAEHALPGKPELSNGEATTGCQCVGEIVSQAELEFRIHCRLTVAAGQVE